MRENEQSRRGPRSSIQVTGSTELHSERLRAPWVRLKKADKDPESGVWRGQLEKLIQQLHGGAEQTVGYGNLDSMGEARVDL